MSLLKRIIPLFLIFAMLMSMPVLAVTGYGQGSGQGGGGFAGGFGGRRGSGYYTVPTTTTADSDGNTTNYYRSGATSSAALINSANQTISFYQNKDYTVNNNTSYWNYKANVDLSNFLNSYTYNITSNTYDIDYNTYVYNTTNNYYSITIDNSTTNYNYDIQVEYAPQYTQVTYVSNSSEVNNVTNIYYYALYDGRSSSELTVNEVFGLATDYSGGNYDLVTEDENTLSLQHFDGNYLDSSAYERTPHMVNRSMEYVDTGDFGQALSLTKDMEAGVKIPGLSDHTSLSIEFRLKFTAATQWVVPFSLYIGSTPVLTPSKTYEAKTRYLYSPGDTWSDWSHISALSDSYFYAGAFSYYYNYGDLWKPSSSFVPPSGTEGFPSWFSTYLSSVLGDRYCLHAQLPKAYLSKIAFTTNQWNSYKIVLTNGQYTLYVNGELLGSAAFDIPDGDDLYFKCLSSSKIYLDELRVSAGDMVTTPDFYDPSTIPFDTNKVLALPDNPEEGKIYVRSSIPVSAIRVGGVRPSNPSAGFVYVPLDKDYKGAGCQISDGTSWEDVDGYIYDSGSWQNVIGYRFLTVGDYDDVTKPDAPVTPSPSPGPGGPGGSSDDDKDSIWDKLGNLVGAGIKGFFSMLTTVAGAVVDGLTKLGEIIGEKFTQIIEMVVGWFDSIPALFAGFMGFLSAIFPFLPPELMLLLTFGLAAVVFIGILKAVRR